MKSAVTRATFGKTPAGRRVDLFTLTNPRGLVAKITSYGTIITELRVPDRRGKPGNVVLGFDNLKQYLAGNPDYFGCTVGRVANRIAQGRFQLAVNNGRTGSALAAEIESTAGAAQSANLQIRP